MAAIEAMLASLRPELQELFDYTEANLALLEFPLSNGLSQSRSYPYSTNSVKVRFNSST
jgi:hypothetical protein